MKIKFINANYTEKIVLDESLIKELQNYKNKTLALYTTTQFLGQIKSIKQQLKQCKVKIITSKPLRTQKKYQILGCNVYQENLNLKKLADAFLYIGTGEFHPSALLFAQLEQQEKPVIFYNPVSKQIKILTKQHLERILNKQKANFSKFLIANSIGVIITTKLGQSHFEYAEKLKQKYPEKDFYNFLCDNLNINELENFPQISAWINTACPRLALNDLEKTEKALVNAEEVLKN